VSPPTYPFLIALFRHPLLSPYPLRIPLSAWTVVAPCLCSFVWRRGQICCCARLTTPSLWILCWISRCPCGDVLCWCPCLIAGFYHPLRFKAVSNWSLVSGGVIWDGCLIGRTGRRDDMSMYASTFRHCLLTHLCVACSFIVVCTITSHATWRLAHHSRCNCSSSTSPSRLSTVHWICFPQLTWLEVSRVLAAWIVRRSSQ